MKKIILGIAIGTFSFYCGYYSAPSPTDQEHKMLLYEAGYTTGQIKAMRAVRCLDESLMDYSVWQKDSVNFLNKFIKPYATTKN